jgi:putative transposase
MMYPLVRDLAAAGVPVAVTCRVLKIARQPYYRWLADPVTAREVRHAYLTDALHDAHAADPEFGYRLLGDEARRAGQVACDRTMWRLASAHRCWSVFGRRRGVNGKRPGPPAHDDHVRRRFTAPGPNRVWLTDISEHPTSEGKVYVCAVKDVWSNRIVGYSISDRMKAGLAVNALVNAVQARRAAGQAVAGCIVHSDRGAQFRSRSYLAELDRHGLVGSMGQVASAGDNAAMESFFALLQNNVLNRRRWTTRTDLRLAIVTWIERTYHRRRRQARLSRLTPIEYELIMTTHEATAA